MNILVIARSAWRDDNSVGRTLTDFFSPFKDDSIYSISLRDTAPDNKVSKMNLSISEMQQIKHITEGGKIGVISEGDTTYVNPNEDAAYNGAKKANLMILAFFREWLWSLGLWKNKNLNDYLIKIKPDVIFMPIYPCWYAHKILKYLKKKTNAKVVIFHADDTYTLKQHSWSPLFWLYRFIQRKWVRSSVELADIHYVISEIQKEDYDKSFGVKNKVLTKFTDFDKEPELKTTYDKPIELVFTGNINLNRWKTLAMIASAIQDINKRECRAILKIYSATPLTREMDKSLNISGASHFCGKVSAVEVDQIQRQADVLVHVEAFDTKNKYIVRQSFSTKIVDYLAMARPILAVGPADVASVAHLKNHNAAFVASSSEELNVVMNKIISDKDSLSMMALAAYNCGRKFHNKKDILNMLLNDIHSLNHE